MWARGSPKGGSRCLLENFVEQNPTSWFSDFNPSLYSVQASGVGRLEAEGLMLLGALLVCRRVNSVRENVLC